MSERSLSTLPPPLAERYVDPRPFRPDEEVAPGADPKLRSASSLALMWGKFQRNRMAVIALFVLVWCYLSLLIVEQIAPYSAAQRHGDHLYAPPQGVHLFHEGRFVGPFVYPYEFRFNMETFKREYRWDTSKPQPIRFFCHGESYDGLIGGGDFHLVCPPEGGTMFLAGTDKLGRDMLSRIVYGARVSLTVGLVGIAISFVIGLTLGGLAGYLGGWVDSAVQRMIEVLRSLPELPLWMALSAAVPPNWSPLTVFFAITIILGLLDWPGLARAVRSKLLSLREEDFVKAAEMQGASKRRIIIQHLAPNFLSHLIASATLSIPAMILGETALSFLGLGLRPPVVSWGVLLNDAQNLASVNLYPWLLLPMLPVIVVILAFNFVGDGLRDAADPYH
jgi:peptide/nickel transport system permease protein